MNILIFLYHFCRFSSTLYLAGSCVWAVTAACVVNHEFYILSAANCLLMLFSWAAFTLMSQFIKSTIDDLESLKQYD